MPVLNSGDAVTFCTTVCPLVSLCCGENVMLPVLVVKTSLIGIRNTGIVVEVPVAGAVPTIVYGKEWPPLLKVPLNVFSAVAGTGTSELNRGGRCPHLGLAGMVSLSWAIAEPEIQATAASAATKLSAVNLFFMG
jgi:hypothetical protein